MPKNKFLFLSILKKKIQIFHGILDTRMYGVVLITRFESFKPKFINHPQKIHDILDTVIYNVVLWSNLNPKNPNI